MKYLHWLPVKYRIMLKLVVYTFKALHGSAPIYIHQLDVSHSRIITCDQVQNTYCSIDPTISRRQQETGRSLQPRRPCGTPALPDELRALGSLKTFMARLKTHYFKLAFSL